VAQQQKAVPPKPIVPGRPAVAQRMTVPTPLRPGVIPVPAVSTSLVIQEARKPAGKKKAPQKKAVVTLTIDGQNYSGVSSGQYGHAEMQALRKFIVAKGSAATAWRALMRAARKKVHCPNQAVCGSCTMILEALGFEPKGVTEFSQKKSRGVSWGANMVVRELMEYGDLGATYQRALKAGAK
jgi:hypothetical protein